MTKSKDDEVTFTVPAAVVRKCYAERAKRLEARAKELDDTATRIAKAIKADPENAAGRDPEPEEDGDRYLGEKCSTTASLGAMTLMRQEAVRVTPKALRAQAVDLRRAAETERVLGKMVSARKFTLNEAQVRALFQR